MDKLISGMTIIPGDVPCISNGLFFCIHFSGFHSSFGFSLCGTECQLSATALVHRLRISHCYFLKVLNTFLAFHFVVRKATEIWFIKKKKKGRDPSIK